MTPGPGIEPGPHWWEASALTTAPSLLPFAAKGSIAVVSVNKSGGKHTFLACSVPFFTNQSGAGVPGGVAAGKAMSVDVIFQETCSL